MTGRKRSEPVIQTLNPPMRLDPDVADLVLNLDYRELEFKVIKTLYPPMKLTKPPVVEL